MQRLAHSLAAVAIDDVDICGRSARRVDHVCEQRAARKRLQHLWQVGFHPLALAGGKDHDGEAHDSESSPDVCAGLYRSARAALSGPCGAG